MPLYDGIDLYTFLIKRYLAYIALLAGWLFFCYWLYARELYPRFHPVEGTTWPVFDENLKMPFAFTWRSDIPLAGKGFEEWTNGIKNVDSSGNILIIRGFYFRDEAETLEKGKKLGLRRARRLIEYLQLSENKTMTEVLPHELDADARATPFEAIDYEELFFNDLLKSSMDTMDICFPLKDSFELPFILDEQLNTWIKSHVTEKESMTYVIGTADGSGIAEAADVAWERALVVKKKLIANGWEDDKINISTGQRSSTQSVSNRCVVIYFE